MTGFLYSYSFIFTHVSFHITIDLDCVIILLYNILSGAVQQCCADHIREAYTYLDDFMLFSDYYTVQYCIVISNVLQHQIIFVSYYNSYNYFIYN